MNPASFAECTRKTVSSCSTVNCSPAIIEAVEYPLGTEFIALELAVTSSFKDECSKTIIAVRILVVLAGYIFL